MSTDGTDDSFEAVGRIDFSKNGGAPDSEPFPEELLVGVAAANGVRSDVPQTATHARFDDVVLAQATEPLLPFLRGDCNDDGKIDIGDAVCVLNWLFAAGGTPGCVAATNTNGDDAANITDATYLLNHLFSGGPAPVAPFPDCGPGMLPGDEELGCANPPNCQ